MKKFLSIIFIAALSFAAITACTKETDTPVEEEVINITIIAGDKNLDNDSSKTKTYVSEEADGIHVYWDESDRVKVLEVIDGEVKHATTSSNTIVSNSGKTATFKASISGIEETGESFTYIAIYPADCYSKDGDCRVLIPGTQILQRGSNLAADADVLISNPITRESRLKNGDVLNYSFKRYGTTVKMTLKGISTGELVRKVDLKAPVGITGYSKIDPSTGEVTKGSTSKSISLILNDSPVDEKGNISVWFRILACSWHAIKSNPIEVKVYTDKHIYSKTIESTKEDLIFDDGGLTTFSINNMNQGSLPTVNDGYYVICTQNSDFYYSLSREANGSRLTAVKMDDTFNPAEIYSGENTDIVWYVSTLNNTTTIQTLDEAYLKSAVNGASVDEGQEKYTISDAGDGKYNICASSSKLAYNTVSKWWGFYGDSSSGVERAIILVPVSYTEVPEIRIEETSATLPSSATSYEINFTKRFLTGDVTAAVAEGGDDIVSALNVEENKVVVTLIPNKDATEKTATINICSENDNVSVPFTIIQEQFRTKTTDVLTAALFTATSSSYTDFSGVKRSGTNGITSDAVYEGKTAKDNDNIQLNSKNGAGIWTTASGGVVSTVSVVYGNASGKNINVYGKNSAFSSNSTEGAELIGTLNDNTLSITATDDYEYILFKSDGATYPASLSITWKAKVAVTEIAVKTAPEKTEYTEGDKFDPTGLVITATYDDTTTKDIAYEGNESEFTFSPALDASLQTTNANVTVTFGGKTADITISVEEAKKHGVTFMSNGEQFGEKIQVKEGANITFPATNPSVDGVVFMGWTKTPITGTQPKAPEMVNTEGEKMGDEDITYYAVFATETEGEISKTFGWEEATVPSDWKIGGTIARTKADDSNRANSGSYYGLTNSNSSVQFTNKVKVKSFSYYCVRRSTNTNTSIKIETSTDGSTWSEALSTAWSTFNSDGKTYIQKKKTWDTSIDCYVRVNLVTGAYRQLDDVSITYDGVEIIDYCTSVVTLTAVEVSGTPTKTTYVAGESFDPAGLTVTGHYSDGLDKAITEGITWSTPAPLTSGQTSVSITATVKGVTSDSYTVNGLTVNTPKTNASIEFSGNASSLQVGQTNDVTVTYNGNGELSAESSNPGVATVSLSGKTLTVTPKGVGSTTIKVSAPETDAYTAATKSYNLTVTAPVQPASLPFEFDGGVNNIASTNGMSQSGLGSDYSTSPKLRFDTQGDNVVINFSDAAAKVTYTIKGNGISGTYAFDVMESADGNTYTTVHSHTSIPASATPYTDNLNAGSRYVKFVYTTKASGNVALGNIKINATGGQGGETDPKEYTYTFTSKNWGANLSVDGGTATTANWTSGKEGGQLTSNQGIQVSKTYSGANGTSDVSYTNVSKVVVKYCTNATSGVGTIKVQIGSGTEKSFSVTKPSSGGMTLKDAEFTFSPNETGKIKITADCTANSVYIYGVTITAN